MVIHTKKILWYALFILLGILIIPNVMASDNAYQVTFTSTITHNWDTGAQFVLNNPCQLTQANYSNQSNTNTNWARVRVWNATNSTPYVICTASSVGFKQANFTGCNLPVGYKYYLLGGTVDNAVPANSMGFNNPASPAHNVTGSSTPDVNWTGEITQNSATSFTLNSAYSIGINGLTCTPTTNVTENITFSSRNPSDITETNLFTYQTANFSFLYQNYTLVKSFTANVTISDIRACVGFINGTCILTNTTQSVVSQAYNTTNGSVANVTFSLSENNVYPFNQNLNFSLLSTYGTKNITLTSNNDYLKDEIENISNTTQYGFYEVPALSSGILRVYYYNSSYDFSSLIATNNNIHEFCVINNISSYNHTHTLYGHQVCPLIINSSGYVGTVKVYNGGFLIRGNTQGMTVFLANISARPTVTQQTNNGGTIWSTPTGTVLSHLHQFSGSDSICIRGVGNYSGIMTNSTQNCDTLQLSPLPPEPPTVYTPITQTYNRTINITWEQAIPRGYPITEYNISLYNSDYTFNSTIVDNLSNTTLSYVWNTYANNLDIDKNYIVSVFVYDSQNSTSNSFSNSFNVSRNGLLNITTKTLSGNTTINNNTLYTIYENGVLLQEINITGALSINITRGNNYSITAFPANFTNQSINVTPTTNMTQDYTYHFSINSFVITFYNETNKQLLNQSITLEVINEFGANNYTVTSGSTNLILLTPTAYTLRYWLNSQPSIPRDYYTTLVPNSYQSLSLYVLDESISQYYLPIIQNQDSSNIGNATVSLLRYYVGTNSYEVVEMSKTDTNGQAVLRVVPNYIYYKLIVTKDSKTLTTDPAKITSATNTFTINLRDSPLTSFYNGFLIYKNLSYNSVTNTYVFTWSDTTNIVTSGCLNVYKSLNGIESTILEQCDDGATGSIIKAITDDNESIYTASAYLKTNTEYSIIGGGQKTVDFRTLVEGFGIIGVFIAVIVVLAFSLIGGENGTRGTVVVGVIAFLMLGAYGIIAYAQEVFIGIIIIAGIIIYKLRSG